MPQIDRLLSVMTSQRASALRLNEHELAELDIGGSARPVTKTALTSAQVVALVREIAPADSAQELDAGRATAFDYVSTDGAFRVEAVRSDDRWRATVTMDERRERQRLNGHIGNGVPEFNPIAPPAAAVAAPASVPAPPTPGPTPAAAPPAPSPASPAPAEPASGAVSDGDAISAFAGSDRAISVATAGSRGAYRSHAAAPVSACAAGPTDERKTATSAATTRALIM